jgi:D-serine deaminase-like pyridoxal phosphate-dependent protein
MIDAGLPDVLIANQVVGPLKVAELARIAGQGRAIVAVGARLRAGDREPYDVYYVVEGDVIVDVWPILGRYGTATAGTGSARGHRC